MLDDEVEYLGSSVTKRASPPSDSLTHQCSVTGITLHVEKSGASPAYDLMFHKTQSRVIQIGRRPGTENDKHDAGKAMFRCPVVSRKHAKIAFTDAGSVYLFDLGSHHGTHVRKPDETISKQLSPELSHLLSSGEIVTLGKSVGKGEDLVRPVVFRVEIQHTRSSPSARLIDLTRSASFERQDSPLLRSPKSSGRYGLNDVSDESSFLNENSSDLEEEVSSSSSSESGKCVTMPHVTNASSHLGHAIEVLKSLIPPLHPPSLPSQRSQPVTDRQSPLFVFPPMNVPAWNSSLRRPCFFPSSPPFDLPPLSVALSENAPQIPDWEHIYDDEPNEHTSDKSRSTSPMVLASPSPAPATSTPFVIGGWPRTRVPSPVPSIGSLYVECCRDPDTTAVSVVVEEQSPPLAVQPESLPIITIASPSSIPAEDDAGKAANSGEIELGSMNASLNDLKVEVARIQSCQDEMEDRVHDKISVLVDKLASLEDRISNLNLSLNTVESSSNVNTASIVDAQNLLFKLQRDLEAVSDSTRLAAQAKYQVEQVSERKDVKDSIETLRQLILEMKTLRDNTLQQMAAEVDSVRGAREAVVEHIQKMTDLQALQSQASAAPQSLKRKRNDDDVECEEANEMLSESCASEQLDETMMVVDGRPGSHTATKADGNYLVHVNALGPNIHGGNVPPRKRARRVASTMFRTATAIAFGAVATWSALAYT